MAKYGSALAVIESRWWKRSNASVRNVYDMLHRVDHDDVEAYHYEMVSSAVALDESITRLVNDNGLRFLTLAMHGKGGKLELANGDKFSIQAVAKAISRGEQEGGRITALHFGSCKVLSAKKAERVLAGTEQLVWVSGYEKDIDWTDSTLLDGLFLNRLLWNKDGEELRTNAPITDVFDRLDEVAGGLIEETRFRLYRKTSNGTERLLPKPKGKTS